VVVKIGIDRGKDGKMNKIYLHADRSSDDRYTATKILNGKLDNHIWGFEYGDVAEAEYQIWEYPSGKIFQVIPDRKVSKNNYYAPPDKGLWLPVLKEIGTDVNRVTEGYKYLSSLPPRKSLIARLKRILVGSIPPK
jgi:hypothetical protein